MAKLNKNLELRTMINDYCLKKGISKNELAVQIGVNSAYLSKIETQKFDEVTDEVLTKIRSAITLRKAPDYIFQTSDLESVFNQCEKTRIHRLMSGLTADTGMGKTTSLRAYSMRENVFFVTVNKSMNAKRLFRAMLQEMQINYDGNIHDVILRIAEELNRIDSPMLILDEAGKLNHSMLLYLHDLREYTKANCGILLCGMPYFKSSLERLSDRQKEGYAEFYRRINIWHHMKGLSRKETEDICRHHGIATDFKRFYNLKLADLMNAILMEQVITNQL